jgi:hypothetical protein
MNKHKNSPHSFHIPVMGLAFTIDSPIKIAKYGISSAISIVDDFLIEKMNEYYSKKHKIPFKEITIKEEDYRAKRITSYLNTIDSIVKKSFENLKKGVEEKSNELEKYIDLLPDFSEIKKTFNNTVKNNPIKENVHHWIQNNLVPGSIDVNIMTKVDKVNFKKNEKLPTEFNDAHAALRGFANSNLESSIVLSAGMNPRLYSYFEKFDDFFPDENGYLKKKVILKVSDYRSALIQGKFLAKKGIWISEYRIESGLNCGGHAFASDGFLMGPILEEFKQHKNSLLKEINSILVNALKTKNKCVPKQELTIKITVQGGVGTSDEHNFLLENYNLDSVGWGSPFLLVPEATTVDAKSLDALKKAKEKDLYLSNISPLGVPFNSLNGNSNDLVKRTRVIDNKPGSSCPKKFLVSNTEFTDKAICTASKRFQKNKIKELNSKANAPEKYNTQFKKIIDKTCLCEGLANAVYPTYNIEKMGADEGVAICPGPNMAYFDQEVSLVEMVKHIYGKNNVISHSKRPHVFIKELSLYINYFNDKVAEHKASYCSKQEKYLTNFRNNLNDGILYYQDLFSETVQHFEQKKDELLDDLEVLKNQLFKIKIPVLVKV